MPRMTDARIAELRALCEKATPGPLEYDRPCVFNSREEVVVRCPTMTEDSEALMMLFAESRTALPELLDDLADLRAEVIEQRERASSAEWSLSRRYALREELQEACGVDTSAEPDDQVRQAVACVVDLRAEVARLGFEWAALEQELAEAKRRIELAGGYHERTEREIEIAQVLSEIEPCDRDTPDIAIGELLELVDAGRNRVHEEIERREAAQHERDALRAALGRAVELLRHPEDECSPTESSLIELLEAFGNQEDDKSYQEWAKRIRAFLADPLAQQASARRAAEVSVPSVWTNEPPQELHWKTYHSECDCDQCANVRVVIAAARELHANTSGHEDADFYSVPVEMCYALGNALAVLDGEKGARGEY